MQALRDYIFLENQYTAMKGNPTPGHMSSNHPDKPVIYLPYIIQYNLKQRYKYYKLENKLFPLEAWQVLVRKLATINKKSRLI